MNVRILFVGALILSIDALPVCAQRLPVSAYGVSEGLPSAFVERIVRDSRGFLWFATRDGLARFNGHTFVTYSVAEGLGHPSVNDILESRTGQYWIATNGGGIFRLDPDPPTSALKQWDAPHRRRAPLLKAFKVGEDPLASRVNRLFEDRTGRIWAGSDNGAWLLDPKSAEPQVFRRVALGPPLPDERPVGFGTFAEDRDGAMWVGSGVGLFRIAPDGSTSHAIIRPQVYGDPVMALLAGENGDVWVGHPTGLLHINGGTRRWLTAADGLGGGTVLSIARRTNGRLWVLSEQGLSDVGPDGILTYSAADGLPDDVYTSLLEDEGQVWIGTRASGVLRINWGGFITWDRVGDVPLAPVHGLFQDHGTVLTVSGDWFTSRFDGTRFQPIGRLPVPAGSRYAWASAVAHFDQRSGWWALSNTALWHFGKTAGPRRERQYTEDDGLVGNGAARVYRDSRGRLWVGTRGPSRSGLSWWSEDARRFIPVTPDEGLPPMSSPTAFAEDRTGNLWVGFYEGNVARFRNRRFEMFTTREGVPPGMVTALLVDRRGRLWIATNQAGVSRVDDPGAATPAFIPPLDGTDLHSQNVRCLVDDAFGRIYLGTSRGVDQFDPETRRVAHFGTEEGLPPGMITAALRDVTGALWFGTFRGVSRFIPQPPRDDPRPAVLIGGLRVSGTTYPIGEVGQRAVEHLILKPEQHRIEVEVISPGPPVNRGIGYQYRLTGIDEWSSPSDDRTLTFDLSPGQYRLDIRAVTRGGVISEAPAVLSFELLAPVWRRWWFLTATLLAVGSGAFALHRHRLRRAVELERVRTRIATDLHDDIGATLSQIAILSEVARTQLESGAAPPMTRLQRIATLSGEAIDSMGDIVWAINPQRDRQVHLVQRMRRLASDLLGVRNIHFRLDHPEADQNVPLGPEVRREVFLIFKESLNNIVRHAHCSRVDIQLSVERRTLRLRVLDDGIGFDPDAIEDHGHGLGNLKRRAEHLGGQVHIDSTPGSGTRIELDVPVGDV